VIRAIPCPPARITLAALEWARLAAPRTLIERRRRSQHCPGRERTDFPSLPCLSLARIIVRLSRELGP